jgi:hypothetical protein
VFYHDGSRGLAFFESPISKKPRLG